MLAVAAALTSSRLPISPYPTSVRVPRLAAVRAPSLVPAVAINDNHSIQSLCTNGDLTRALSLLPLLRDPTQRTYEALILACARASHLAGARAVHRRISCDAAFSGDPFLATRLISLYSDLGLLDDARAVFDEIADKTIYVYNVILKALAVGNEAEDALLILQQMAAGNIGIDSFTYAHSLKACIAASASADLAAQRVREIHGHALRRGFASGVHVGTTLIDCYGKLGFIEQAEWLFDAMDDRNVFTWSAMIGCYAKNELYLAALELFQEMMSAEHAIEPTAVTVVSVLSACAGLSAVEQGKVLHGCVLRRGLDKVVPVVNALIDMYAKSGCLDLAHRVFHWSDGIRDVVSWNSLISGYEVHGLGREAIRLFEDMTLSGVSPSLVTFLSVLGACSHSGLVEEGMRIFELMSRKYGIEPCVEHYACVVDLLGRAGKLEKAVKIIEGMPIRPSSKVWGALLGASRIHCNVEFAQMACSYLFELEPSNAGNYILLADIYAKAGLSEDVDTMKKLLEDGSLHKVPGCSWIELHKKVHCFVSVDETNTQIEELEAFLVQLVTEMKKHGYVPDTKVVLYDLEEEEKEKILLGHSEKLAMAFGLLNSAPGEVIRITKNLRLCEDCHLATKFVSRLFKREILVRDVNRFHHFKDGECSCSDYW